MNWCKAMCLITVLHETGSADCVLVRAWNGLYSIFNIVALVFDYALVSISI